MDEREQRERMKLSGMQHTVYKTLIDDCFAVVSMPFVTHKFYGLILWRTYIDNLETIHCMSCV